MPVLAIVRLARTLLQLPFNQPQAVRVVKAVGGLRFRPLTAGPSASRRSRHSRLLASWDGGSIRRGTSSFRRSPGHSGACRFNRMRGDIQVAQFLKLPVAATRRPSMLRRTNTCAPARRARSSLCAPPTDWIEETIPSTERRECALAAASDRHEARPASNAMSKPSADYALRLSDCSVPAGSVQNDRVCSAGPLDGEGGRQPGGRRIGRAVQVLTRGIRPDNRTLPGPEPACQ